MSLIKTAICALFAASATRLKSLRKGDASLTPRCVCVGCWLGAWAGFADAAGWEAYEDVCEAEDEGGAPWKYCDGCERDGEESGASIVGTLGRAARERENRAIRRFGGAGCRPRS